MLVNILPHTNKRLKIQLAQYLNKELFARYVEACRTAGAHFNTDLMTQEVEIERLGELVYQLLSNGFKVVVDDGVRALVDKKAAEVREMVGNAEAIASELKLRPYQAIGARWYASRNRALLGDEPGLGKTIQALCALDRNPVLVVCPQIAKANWALEIDKWLGVRFNHEVLAGRGSFRWPESGEIVITNFDILPKVPPKKHNLPSSAGKPQDNTTLVVDEAHYIKNSKAARSRSVRAISRVVRNSGGRVWLMTGTPLANKPPELWSILTAADLAIDAFGSWPNFVRLFGGVEINVPRPIILWPDGVTNKRTIHPSVPKMLERVMLRRLRQDVMSELPPREYKDIVVPLSSQTRRIADRVWSALKHHSEEQILRDFDLVGSEVVGILSAALRAIALDKVPSMMAIVKDYEEQEEPLVVVSDYRAPIEELGRRLGWRAILGGDDPGAREAAWRGFQAGTYGEEPARGLAMTIKAGGISITATRAAHMLMVDQSWNPSDNEQVISRLQRISQTRTVMVTRLIANHPIDQLKTKALTRKAAMIAGAGL